MKKLLILLITFLPLLINAQAAWWQVEQGAVIALPYVVNYSEIGYTTSITSGISVDYPNDIETGDLLVLILRTSVTTNVTSSGFTTLDYEISGTDRGQVNYKILDGSETGTFTITASSGTTAHYSTALIRNVSTIGATSLEARSSTYTTLTFPDVVADYDNSVAFQFLIIADNNTPSGEVDYYEVFNVQTTDGTDASFSIYTQNTNQGTLTGESISKGADNAVSIGVALSNN